MSHKQNDNYSESIAEGMEGMKTYKEAKNLWLIARNGYNWPLYSKTQQKASLAIRKLCVLFYEIKKWEWEKSLEYIEIKLQKRRDGKNENTN